VKALREMARVCKTEQQGGRLLLLEHGRSWLWPVNVLLDRSVNNEIISFFSSIFPVSVAGQIINQLDCSVIIDQLLLLFFK